MQLDKAIKERHSVRKFKDKKPDWRNIIEAIETARYAPMAGNIFSLKFILIDDREKINMIGDCCQQDFVKDAHYILVVCSNPRLTKTNYGEDAKKYCQQQAGAAIQNVLLKLTEVGLSTTWIGYFAEDVLKRDLKIPVECDIEAIFPIGYEFKETKTRRAKPDLDSFLRFNNYKNEKMRDHKKLNV